MLIALVIFLTDPFQLRILRSLEDIVSMLTLSTKTRKKKEMENDLIVEEWKMVSRVLDRFFFIIFGFATLLFNVIILTQSPFSTEVEYSLEDGPSMSMGHGYGGGH